MLVACFWKSYIGKVVGNKQDVTFDGQSRRPGCYVIGTDNVVEEKR
jgi:hypothetical protein